MKTTHPITPTEIVEFRNLLFPPDDSSEKARQTELADALGLNHSTIWRLEQHGATVQHGVMLRRALVNLADELGVRISERLRFGEAKRARRAGAGR